MQRILTIGALLFLSAYAAAAEYVVAPENVGACYLGDEEKSAARTCGKCLQDAGDAVVRTFRVFCSENGIRQKTEKALTLSVDCDSSEQEVKSDAWWMQQAEKEMKSKSSVFSSEQCDLGGWPWLSKKNMLIGGGVVAGIASALFIFKKDDDATEDNEAAESGDDVAVAESGANYTIEKKRGNNAAECRSGPNKRLKSGGHRKHCHNCRSKGGDRVVWKYDVYCNGVLMENQTVTAELICKQKMPDETGQKELLEELAQADLERQSANWQGCEVR